MGSVIGAEKSCVCIEHGSFEATCEETRSCTCANSSHETNCSLILCWSDTSICGTWPSLACDSAWASRSSSTSAETASGQGRFRWARARSGKWAECHGVPSGSQTRGGNIGKRRRDTREQTLIGHCVLIIASMKRREQLNDWDGCGVERTIGVDFCHAHECLVHLRHLLVEVLDREVVL